MRRDALARRRLADPKLVEAAGHAVAELLVALPRVREAPQVALYAGVHDELPTRPLFEALAGTGCSRLLPRVVGGSLEFAPIDAWSELRTGRYGIPAPPPGRPAVVLSARDVVVVPGVAFDVQGRRVGRGGGHYDRAFTDETTPGPLRIGVGLHLQLVAELPCDSHDRPVDAIVTERGVHWAAAEPESGA